MEHVQSDRAFLKHYSIEIEHIVSLTWANASAVRTLFPGNLF